MRLYILLIVLGLIEARDLRADTSHIKHVHVVFSNHLDVGFTDFARNVINSNLNEYFTRALRTAEEAKALNITYKYMTHCYLVSLFLHCPPFMGFKCPSEETVKRFIKASQDGYVYWHAFPFNSQQENYNPSLFEFGIQLCKDLYYELNITARPPSIVLSQRDVPGMTRGVIPYLVKHGIKAISVGVNMGSSAPDVPDIFRWKSVDGKHEVLVIYHPDGYGGIDAKSCPIINNNVTSYDHTLATEFRRDNSGPQFIERVIETVDQIGLEFKNAQHIFGSTFTEFVTGILDNETVYNSLPIIDTELGDTWSFGDQADPYKASITRIIQRRRAEYLKRLDGDDYSDAFYNFSRLLIKCGEHTFGAHMGFLDPVTGEIIGVFTNKSSEYYAWSNAQFEAVRDTKHMTELRDSWYEQRNLSYYWPLQALEMTTVDSERDLYNGIMNEIEEIKSPISPLDDAQFDWKIQSNHTFYVGSTRNFKVTFDAVHGSIASLMDTKANEPIDFAKNIGSFLYQSFTEKAFDEYIKEYSIKPDRIWVYYNFGKVGLDVATNGTVRYQNVNGYVLNLYRDKNDANMFCVEYRVGSNDSIYKELREYYGVPNVLYHVYNFSGLISGNSGSKNHNKLSLQFIQIDKQTTRIPEALWVVFEPGVDCMKWRVNKFDQMMDIEDVVKKGQYHIHGTMGNVSCEYAYDRYFQIESIDAGIAGFKPLGMDTFTPFPTPFTATNVQNGGVAFNLYNNIWGTNFVEYYPFDIINTNATYRFNVYF